MLITGTFLDEISHDIPRQNWGEREWREDFATMKRVGIDTVILIRSGYQRWLTYLSAVLTQREHGREPVVDLVDLINRLGSHLVESFVLRQHFAMAIRG